MLLFTGKVSTVGSSRDHFPSRVSDCQANVRDMSDGTVHHDPSDESWSAFTQLLESRLTAMSPGGSLAIDMNGPDDIGAPYVQVLKAPDGDGFYAELSSNRFLSRSFRLDGREIETILGLGWFPPDLSDDEIASPNFHGGVEGGDSQALASIVASTFREVYPHFLPEMLAAALDASTPRAAAGAPEFDVDVDIDDDDADDSRISDDWSEFAEGFIQNVLGCESDEAIVVVVDRSLGDASPMFRAFLSDDGQVAFLEVSSNQTLPELSRHSATQIGWLLRLGWNPPSPPNEDPQVPSFHVATDVEDIRSLAGLLIDTLRVVFGIPHPSFLRPAPVEDELHQPAEGVDPHWDEEPLPISQAYPIDDLDDLHWAVSHVIRHSNGSYIAPDENGVFALRMGSSGVLIAVRKPAAISVVAFVVSAMRWPDRAVTQLQELNEISAFTRFHIHNDSIMATCDIPANPFVPAHLIEVMHSVGVLIDEVDDDLAALTGGVVLFGNDYRPAAPNDVESHDDEDSDPLPEELLALIQMDNEPDVHVDPELAARLFRRDRSQILKCIRQCEEQTISWTESARDADSEGDPDEAEVCYTEASAWEDMASLLRQSLPFTI